MGLFLKKLTVFRSMDKKLEKQFRERAVELGKSSDPAALPELVELSRLPVANVRRLAAVVIMQ